MTIKLDQVKHSARELKSAVAEFEVTNAALMVAVEKKLYSDKPSTTATNAAGREFVSNDILANYERV